MVNGHQLSAARSLAGIDLRDLAQRAGVGADVLAALEASGAADLPDTAAGLAAVQRALAVAGIRFLNEGGRGVMLKPRGPVDEGLRPEALSAENDD